MCNSRGTVNTVKRIMKLNQSEMDRCLDQYKKGNLSVVSYFNQCDYINATSLTAIRKVAGI